ncbi:glutathione S-transferase family protein [Marinobacter sp.]|uniref:glutathione S-transferase family protein n=1 Tax=Marinobacter sp. TaxID=50741 RepID=UPI0034A1AC65
MIELYQFAPAWGINLSPFCLKVEIYCQLAGIPYETRSTLPLKGPRGKLPFIIDQSNTVPDSGKIIEYLKETCGDPLDAQLSEEGRAMGHMLRQVCEESLYFAILYSRWLDDRYWPKVRQAFFGSLPPVARSLVAAIAHRGIRNSLIGQGYGRYPREEVYAAGAADLAAIAWQLNRQSYAAGDQLTSFDATLYAFLFNVVQVPLETPLKAEAAKHPVIDAYLNRVHDALDAAERR